MVSCNKQGTYKQNVVNNGLKTAKIHSYLQWLGGAESKETRQSAAVKQNAKKNQDTNLRQLFRKQMIQKRSSTWSTWL